MAARASAIALLAIAALALASPASASAVDERSVQVVHHRDGRTVPCPALERDGAGSWKGGCLIGGRSQEAVFHVLTVMQEIYFSRCFFGFDLRVDGRGRAVISDSSVGGVSPCNDSLGCYRGLSEESKDHPIPWRGRIAPARDGRFPLYLGACMDTCMGKFAGPLELGLRGTPADWRARADGATIGDSGWLIDAVWELDPPRGFEIRSSGP